MKANDLVSAVLTKLVKHVRPGVTTFTLDCIAEEEIKALGGFSFNKGYHPAWARFPYPAVLCANVNDSIAHAIPNQRKLKEGDIITLDLGVIDSEGNCGDAAICVPVGEISEQDKMLIRYAKSTLYAGIKVIKNGVTVRQIAQAMERKANERKFVINRQLAGHGIGKRMHEDPPIYQVTNHYAHVDEIHYKTHERFMDIELKTGMTVCLEPMVTFSDSWGVIDSQTGWEFKTRDGKKSAMFEHMIKVTDDGHEILTTHFEPFKLK